MPSFTRVLLLVTLCVGRNLAAQPSFDPSMALLALPSELRQEAAIMTYGEDGLFEVLRHGTNDWFCIADRPGDQRFSAQLPICRLPTSKLAARRTDCRRRDTPTSRERLERAKEIGRKIDRELEARGDVAAVLNGGG